MGGDQDEPLGDEGDEAPIYEPGEVRAMEIDRERYYQPGRLNVVQGPDGLPQFDGDPPEPPEVGLTDDNLVCTAAPGRPACEHLRGILTNAPGVARGFAKMRAARRFCMAMSTGSELFDLEGVDVYACLSRRPQDPGSLSHWADFERRQKKLASDAAQTRGEMDW